MLNSVESLLCKMDATVHANKEEKRQGNADFGYNNIAFSANRADSCCLGSNSRVRFETTITSAGGGWDGRAGVFTVPEAGTYYFSWNTVSPSNEELQLFLMVDGKEKANCYAEFEGRDSCSGSIVLRLRRNDVVTLRIKRGQMFEDQGEISFNSITGYMIF